jgi:hypothetical protein
MTTFIQQETETYFTVITAKGKKIEVSFRSHGRVSIYILRNGMSGFAGGKHFGSMAEAIASYKSADVKAALEALQAV